MTTTMPDVDAERLAALIEGRLPPDERERVLVAIDKSTALRDAYTDALAALGAMTPAPVREVPRWNFLASLTPLQKLEVAAAAVVLIAMSPLVFRQLVSTGVPDTGDAVASIALSDSAATGILNQPVWGVTRGDGEGTLSPDARGIRVGAAIASYELRRNRADSLSAAAALEVAALLESAPGGAIAANAWRSMGNASAITESSMTEARRLAEQVAGAERVRLGAWLQGARFASAASDTEFFSDRTARSIAKAAITLDERVETGHAARQFEQIVSARPRDWTATSTAVEELLRLLGTR